MFFNFSCVSKVIHETIARKRDRDLRSGRNLGTRYWVAHVGWSTQPKMWEFEVLMRDSGMSSVFAGYSSKKWDGW